MGGWGRGPGLGPLQRVQVCKRVRSPNLLLADDCPILSPPLPPPCRVAVEEGHFHQGKLVPGLARAEVNLHAMTAGVAMLSLYAWLVSLKQLLAQHGASALPLRLAVVTDRGKGSKEQGNLVVKEAVQAAVALWDAPFRWVGGWVGRWVGQPAASPGAQLALPAVLQSV